MSCCVRRCRQPPSCTTTRRNSPASSDIDGKKVPYGYQRAWIAIATLNGLPATVAPIAQSAEGLPIGVQIIGNFLEDRTTIAFAGLIEREFGGFIPPPTSLRHLAVMIAPRG
jgi:Asp-tRNA(Asn)/Glu-tRNA(Gln) amidotransferase A subunit family amidase